MTQPRSEVINLDFTPYYHCIGRCVRRAFLCGQDHYSGQSFEHRRQWIIELLTLLEQNFCIDIAAYALMSNHYHLVLHVDREQCLGLSDREVIRRYLQVDKSRNTLVKRYLAGGPVTGRDRKKVAEQAAVWRERLYSISWFMKFLNERVARRANQEDQCKGKFWESRYKCQALLDEAAVLTCMAYVDLNPVRAKLCESLSQSDYTSIQQRLEAVQKEKQRAPEKKTDKKVVSIKNACKARSGVQKPELMLFQLRTTGKQSELKSSPKPVCGNVLPFYETDYLQWVDYLGRISRTGKRGVIPDNVKPIFDRLDMEVDRFIGTLNQIESLFPVRMGQYATLVRYAEQAGLRWSHGFGHSRNICQVQAG